MCGVGGKADRRPIDPPPIVQLRVVDPLASSASARRRQGSPNGRRSTESMEDEGVDADERERERLVLFFLFVTLKGHGFLYRRPESPSHRDRDPNRSRDKDDRDRDRDRERDREREKDRERDEAAAYAQSYLQNPYYFMFASLAKPDDDAELHWLKVCIFSVSCISVNPLIP